MSTTINRRFKVSGSRISLLDRRKSDVAPGGGDSDKDRAQERALRRAARVPGRVIAGVLRVIRGGVDLSLQFPAGGRSERIRRLAVTFVLAFGAVGDENRVCGVRGGVGCKRDELIVSQIGSKSKVSYVSCYITGFRNYFGIVEKTERGVRLICADLRW